MSKQLNQSDSLAWVKVIFLKICSCTVTDIRKQPSDVSKNFIKYCLVGWGLPAVIVVLCSVLDCTGTFHLGYGL